MDEELKAVARMVPGKVSKRDGRRSACGGCDHGRCSTLFKKRCHKYIDEASLPWGTGKRLRRSQDRHHVTDRAPQSDRGIAIGASLLESFMHGYVQKILTRLQMRRSAAWMR
ncbi:MAG: hypothetical protein ACLTSZ_13235 [Lachnospiraceae bacterium]